MIRYILSQIGLGWLVPGSAKLDVTLGDRDAKRLRQQLSRGKWQDAHTFLEQTKKPDERDFYIEALSMWPGRPDWLDKWVAERPNTAIPLLVRGAHAIQWAWEARGGDTASKVTGGQFKLFFDRLAAAETDLKKAASLDKNDPTPWSRLLQTAIGLQLSKEELHTRFQEAIKRDATHRTAHSKLLTSLCSRWGGSEKKLFAFARKASSTVHAGHSLVTLIVEAHIEHRIDVVHDGGELDQYFKQPGVQQDIFKAAKRSIQSEHHQESQHTLRDRNMFALCFFEMQELELAKEQFKAIAGRATRYPWIYYEDPLAAFHECRRDCR